MALKADVDFMGIKVLSAYAALDPDLLALSKTSMRFSLAYSTKAGQPPFQVCHHECSYSIDGLNPFEQAYAYLKTLPEFEGSTDY